MGILKQIIKEFSDDNCASLAASLSYYSLFALPPLLYLLVMGLAFGLSISFDSEGAEKRAKTIIESQAASMLGNPSVSDEISTILERTQHVEGKWWRSMLSLAGVIFGATGALAALRSALNQVWQVKADPTKASFWSMVRQRVFSLGMILVLGFLLVISLVVSSIATGASARLEQLLGIEGTIAVLVDYVVQAVVVCVMFAAILRYIPDAVVQWRDVAYGAAITTALFLVGRLILQLYFSFAEPGAELGAAAGSLVALLLWVYYSSLILLLGAEITQVLASRSGRSIVPKEHAIQINASVNH